MSAAVSGEMSRPTAPANFAAPQPTSRIAPGPVGARSKRSGVGQPFEQVAGAAARPYGSVRRPQSQRRR